jgi:hypothetical protein
MYRGISQKLAACFNLFDDNVLINVIKNVVNYVAINVDKKN